MRTDVANKANLKKIVKEHERLFWKKFQIVLMDPPWKGAGQKDPVRGMNIAFKTEADNVLFDSKLEIVQDKWVVFLWVTSRVKEEAELWLKEQGYILRDEILWVKVIKKQRVCSRT